MQLHAVVKHEQSFVFIVPLPLFRAPLPPLGPHNAWMDAGALSLVCERSYDGPEVDRPQECQPWDPVCKSTGYCTTCDGSFASGESFPCSREVPYCQKSNGRCKYCTSDVNCLSPVYPTCDSDSGACTEYVPSTPAPSPCKWSQSSRYSAGRSIKLRRRPLWSLFL